MPTLLVIDDETSILTVFSEIFSEPGVTVLTADTARRGLQLVQERQPDVVILDLKLPDLPGLEAFRRLRQIDARVPVLFITGHGTTSSAIEAMKLGAFDYLLKPLELDQLRHLLQRAFEISRMMRVPALLEEEPNPSEDSDVLVGRCPAMQDIYKAIGRVAFQDVTVLILGESGTGKELVARAIYQHSRRADRPFLAVNCAAIPEALLESELFGHEKGSFTGADRKRIGKFEQCLDGTLFLDEIGDMTPLTQTKVLRVLQDQRFERVGGNETIQSNVRLIAATNRNLEDMVAEGTFRSDLYYRLNVVTLRLPPLRERLEDLPLLVEHFLRRCTRELGLKNVVAAPETLELLRQHHWPGNIRELQSVLKQALLHSTGPILLPDFLPSLRAGVKPLAIPPATPVPLQPDWDRFLEERLASNTENLYCEWLELAERHLLTRVLQQTQGNQVQAARILGLSRNCLRAKIRTLGITLERQVSSSRLENNQQVS